MQAFPKLTHFKVRGGNGLTLSPITHEGLRCFEVESGGLSTTFVKGFCDSKMPKLLILFNRLNESLETLDLWLGTEYYGANWRMEDLVGSKHIPNS